jgi:geranylgeranyl pyrophosphate synthase
MNFDETLKAHHSLIEENLAQYLPPIDAPPALIHEAMHYCINAGGKRLRPIIVLASANIFPAKADPIPAAISIEYLHTYTLIHDDLPSMDDSPLRRGRPSAHIQFGEATAVLAGDALLTEAFGLIAKEYAQTPETGMKLIQTLADAAGSRKLIGGQLVDTVSENIILEQKELDFVHQHKTADLLTAAIIMGFHCSDTPATAFPIAEKIGKHLGLAFQIIDDILDATSDSNTLGKTTGNDEKQAKNTYVSLLGLQKSRDAAQFHTDAALNACEELNQSDTFLTQLIASLANRIF